MHRSYFFYALMGILGIGVLLGMALGIAFLLRRLPNKTANRYFGLLLIAFSMTLMHSIFVLSDLERYIVWPLYFTLSLPSLLFFYVKTSLFPGYRLKPTDSKHFVLPLGQLIFFLGIFLGYFGRLERSFYQPFYGAFEQVLYLSTFYFYLYSAHKYIQFKAIHFKDALERRRVAYMKLLVGTFVILFAVHTLFVVTDFISYEFFRINLRSLKLYVGLGALSFGALVYWLVVYGIQTLIWSKGRV
ncbi:MAG: hypothetical protein NWR67_00940 [Saprospiraceae bacterium]|jgi:hypothetical protein|nr:hypothetical protein [Saprospiraceae bacterium]MDP4819543.1 hypothetical protein [Saprospiraceae bacterium]